MRFCITILFVLVLSASVEGAMFTQEQWESQSVPYNIQFRVVIVDVTAYAPLDPNAVRGVCYSGDPTITASGARVVPGITAAAGSSIPFGTKVWIEGIGWRTVQDRGGMISDRHIDIVMTSRSSALRFGRVRNVIAIFWY